MSSVMIAILRLAHLAGIVGLAASAGCSSGPAETICRGLACSEAEWQEVFDRSVQDLYDEGIEITPESYDDPVHARRLRERMLQLVGGVPEAEAEADTGTQSLAVYDGDRDYCGPAWFGDWSQVSPGDCLNRVCFEHDRCYDGIANYGVACPWSQQTDTCDARFFAEYRACSSRSACGVACHAVAAAALGLKTLCINPLFTGRPAVRAACLLRAVTCRQCTPIAPTALCADREVTCGSLPESCGGTAACGTCSDGQTCVEHADGSATCSTCPGAPVCSGHGRCDADTSTCACDAGWTGPDCATPPATCQDGRIETQPCGNCGTRSRTCTGGAWGSWSACGGQGECAAGATESCGSGGSRSCSATCTWSACSGQTCVGPSSQACGACGTQTRACDAGSGQWSPWGACQGQGLCSPGATQSCGGASTQTCTATCTWGACGSTCGNGTCDGAESPLDCPSDCAPVAIPAERLGRVTQGGCSATTIGWHATTGSAYWTYATACTLPSVFDPPGYTHEVMRWRWQVRKPGNYRVVVSIPSSAEACGFSLTNFATGARYYLLRPGAGTAADLRIVDQQANAGRDVTIASALNSNAGELALYLYDSAADQPAPCCDCATSRRVFYKDARLEWVP